MKMMTQEMLDLYATTGAAVIDQMLAVGATYLSEGSSKQDRDVNLGRDLAMAVFLAAIGDQRINRLWLIEGFAHAVGECQAQQPAGVEGELSAAINRGFAAGHEMAALMFPQAGVA